MPEIELDGEELPRLSPGVGCDSTAQGDKVTRQWYKAIRKIKRTNAMSMGFIFAYKQVTHLHSIACLSTGDTSS